MLANSNAYTLLGPLTAGRSSPYLQTTKMQPNPTTKLNTIEFWSVDWVETLKKVRESNPGSVVPVAMLPWKRLRWSFGRVRPHRHRGGMGVIKEDWLFTPPPYHRTFNCFFFLWKKKSTPYSLHFLFITRHWIVSFHPVKNFFFSIFRRRTKHFRFLS